MSQIDWTHVNNLLGAIHGAASAGPKYTYITARAEAELTKHMQDNPEAPAVEPAAPVTAPPAALAAVPPADPVYPPPEDTSVVPGEDATATTAVERRV